MPSKAAATPEPEAPVEPVPSEPGTIKYKDDFIAIKTAPTVTAGAWFVFHPANGGGYSTGEAERLDYPDSGWETERAS